MRSAFILGLLVLSACGGSLSDEQRKQLKEGMEQQKIVKVSDAEILSNALRKGQSVLKSVQPEMNPRRLDSLERVKKVKIRFLVPGQSNARAIEQELIEAYIMGITTGTSGENLQKIWNSEQKNDYDSLLFSRPQLRVNEEGVEELEGIWNIYMARKDIVLDIARDR